jgi:hypothetical protein
MKSSARLIRNFFRKLKKFFFKEKDFWSRNIPEVDIYSKNLIEMVGHHTMTPLVRRWNLIKAIHYINKKKLEGDIVESGIWRGGNLFLSKKVQDKYYSQIKRKFYGYDTFEGMPKPSHHDELRMSNLYENFKKENKDWAKASIEDVVDSAKFFFKDINDFNFIKGKVEQTLIEKKNLPSKISLLRLDTDWYESTKIELNVLYPLLVDNGVLIIDDYGDMIGCREAVDEFFKDKNILITSIDKSCRIIIKN